jgi:hypothetical protein
MRSSMNAGEMRLRIIKTVLLLLITCAGFAQAAKVEEQVNRLNAAIFRDKDSAVLDDLLYVTVTYGHSSGKIENRAEMINGAVYNKAGYRDFRMENFSVFFADKKTAIVGHVLRAITIDNGTESPLQLSVLQTWIRKKGKWKLAARQAVRI